MGLVSSITTPDNQIDFLEEYMDSDYINANYDICVKPEANIFSKRFAHYMEEHIEKYSEIKIPIYVIACGLQADSYDDIDGLIGEIGDVSSRFIRSVYNTGGEFCLRGYFTKEFFTRLGFHSAVVTGCPSMYQFGREFKVDYSHVNAECFRPALNGQRIKLLKKQLYHYQNSQFFDQSVYFAVLYGQFMGDDKSFIKKYGYLVAKLLRENRLNLFIDLQDWADYLKYKEFNFSCGSRIHGNIMSILMGIPAAVCPIDTRTREMAEFFDIPTVSERDLKKKDLYEIYLNTTYDLFNRSFADKYDAYERFLIERGIVKKANTNSLLRREMNLINIDRLKCIDTLKTDNAKVLDVIEKKKVIYQLYDFLKEMYIGIKER